MNSFDLERFVKEVLKEAKENNFFEVVDLISDIFKQGYYKGLNDGYDKAVDRLIKRKEMI